MSQDTAWASGSETATQAARRRGNVYSGRPAPRRTGGAEIARRIARGFGEVLITFGLIVLLFAIYEVYGKTQIVDAHQNDLEKQLTQVWNQPAPITGVTPGYAGGATPHLPAPGGPLGRLYIPVLHLHWVVVEGVTLQDIAYAPGHYPGTAQPGEIGNFAVAGHRIPSIFWDLQKVQPGQLVIVETRDYYYEYKTVVNELVTPHSVEVVAPTPDHPGVAPTKAMLTLTTCNPKWDNYQRMVVHAVLVKKQAVKSGPPAPLGS